VNTDLSIYNINVPQFSTEDTNYFCSGMFIVILKKISHHVLI